MKSVWTERFRKEQGFHTILNDFLSFDLDKIDHEQNEKILKDVAFWLTLIKNNLAHEKHK